MSVCDSRVGGGGLRLSRSLNQVDGSNLKTKCLDV